MKTRSQPDIGALPAPGPTPIRVVAERAGLVESRHRVACAVVDASGKTAAAWGDVAAPVFPRSAIKPLQALTLIESGAADAFGLGAREIALAAASHNGEPAQVEAVRRWLKRIGLTADDLECGGHWPRHEADRERLIRAGESPDGAFDNCSGKHAGMLSVARHLGHPTADYTSPDHPVQRRILACIADLAGVRAADMPIGIDGCSAPNPALPLSALAHAFGRFAAARDTGDAREDAARRVQAAMAAEPFMVAGTGRICTHLIATSKGRIVAKSGAEGVYACALPDLGLGIAIKAEDGAARAAEAVLAGVLITFGALAKAQADAVAPLCLPLLRNRRGRPVGRIAVQGDGEN